MAENLALNFETFAAHLNTSFKVQLAADLTAELRLIEANDKSVPKQEMFSLIFHGPEQAFLPQQIYQIEHDRIGVFDLFIVPVGRDEDGYRYEAIFNRVRNQS
jgi:hypothetical protein